MPEPPKILWIDDELELLKPHFIFLEKKGFSVEGALSGSDALAMLELTPYDVVLLDENMPGLSGLETLLKINELHANLPVVMVTKSEEEELMEKAIAGKIADFLIKPVNPNQMLLALKKILQRDMILEQATLSGYRQAFGQISARLSSRPNIEEWKELYRDLTRWSLEIDAYSPDLREMYEMQHREAEMLFSRHVKEHYERWMSDAQARPVMSADLFPKKVFPLLDAGEKVFFVLIDNFRFDQWLSVKSLLAEHYTFDEAMYVTMLPTATQYARNAIFSALLPDKIAKMFPELWVDEESDEGKNLNEEPLIRTMLERYRKAYSFSYNKVYETQFGERLLARLDTLAEYPLNVIVLNFVDMLSHARTESKMIRELAHDESAYRSLTRSWFKHSTTFRLFEKMAQMGYKVILTTDHGCVRVKRPVKIIGERNTGTNLRYKLGKHLTYDEKEAFTINHPAKFGLPGKHLADKFVFCTEENFFAYPNNYNYYVNYYRDTFQHGGISLEEMLVPLITLTPKKASAKV